MYLRPTVTCANLRFNLSLCPGGVRAQERRKTCNTNSRCNALHHFLKKELWLGLLLSAPKSHNRNRYSDFRVDWAKSPEQKEGVLGSEIAARNRKSLVTSIAHLDRNAASCLGNRVISGVRDGHCNRKSQKSLRFRCAKGFWHSSELGYANHTVAYD